MVSAIIYTIASAYGGVNVSAYFRINVSNKTFFTLLAIGATVTGLHAIVWF
jgi:hypothetical protein